MGVDCIVHTNCLSKLAIILGCLILNILVVEEDIKGYDGPQIKEIIDGKMDLENKTKGRKLARQE
jgi:hypothetical protein